MFSGMHTTEADGLLADTSDIKDLRAQRVWQLINVAWFTWLFFTVFCWVRGFSMAAIVCFSEVVVIWLIIKNRKRNARYYRIMNFSLATCAVGILLVSLSNQALQRTMLFYPISILIASQLLGIRAAFQWLVVNIAAISIFFLIQSGPLDELALMYGVAVCLFFCCQQGEEFYRDRTKGLVDVSQRLQAKADVLHTLATTDSLTGLLNRFQFQKELRDSVEHAVTQSERMALLVVDMDGFKEINDTLGHPTGDQALMAIADRLRRDFHDQAVIARLAGDEFCLICSNVGSVEHATAIAKRVCEVLTTRYVLDECDFPLGASIGLALCPDHARSDTELLSYADTAMFAAKENRRGYAAYDPDMTDRLIEYRTMQEQLSSALENNEFFLVYQPQISLATGKVIGVEALLRWRREDEVIPPFRFIPLLEKSREIVPVGRWIIRETCRQLRTWTDAGFDVEVSINLSSVQFNDDELYRNVTESLCEFDLDAAKLDFEITESLLVDDVDKAVQRLHQLKKFGASVSIDDFGTGYSSLAYLQQFPIDRLKIDRAFVKDIPDADDGVIATSIVALAKALGLKVLAEGVETKSQLEFFKSLDCDEYQGYYYSGPVSTDEIMKLLLATESRIHQCS